MGNYCRISNRKKFTFKGFDISIFDTPHNLIGAAPIRFFFFFAMLQIMVKCKNLTQILSVRLSVDNLTTNKIIGLEKFCQESVMNFCGLMTKLSYQNIPCKFRVKIWFILPPGTKRYLENYNDFLNFTKFDNFVSLWLYYVIVRFIKNRPPWSCPLDKRS